MFLPFRESGRSPDPALPRDCSKGLRRHPRRLGSETLPLLQRWSRHTWWTVPVNAGTLRRPYRLDSTRPILNSASVGMHSTHWMIPIGNPVQSRTPRGCALSVWPGMVTFMPIRSTHCAPMKRPTPFLGRRPSSPATDRWSIWRLCTAVKLTGKCSPSHRRDGLTKGPSCNTTRRPAHYGIRKKMD